MQRRTLTLAVGAALVVSIAATILVYERLHPAATGSGPPTSLASFTPIPIATPLPSPLGTMVPPPWIPWPTGAPSGTVNSYTVPDYGRTFPSGFGPPHAASLAELASSPGCDPATSIPDPYGPCGWGAFIRCDNNPWTPACNQRLSNGTTCGFGLQDCIAEQLTCRLPVTGGATVGGFVNFATGEFTPDPTSDSIRIRWPSHHGLEVTYDHAYRRWIPTSMALIAPDGSHYADLDEQWAVHDVGLVDHSDRVVSPPGSWLPLAYAEAGIYGVPFDPANGQGAGLWLLRAKNAKPISRSGYWSIVGGGAAYGHPTQNPIASPNQLVRLDLSSGTSTPWFRRPQQYVDVVGFDGDGHPIIWASGGQEAGNTIYGYREIWLVTGQNSGVKLVSGVLDFVEWTVSDPHGIWLASSEGVYLLTVVTDSGSVPHPVFARVASPRWQPILGTCA